MKTRDPKKNGRAVADISQLAGRAAEMEKVVEHARIKAHKAKAEFKKARKALKMAKKAAKLARKEAKAALKRPKGAGKTKETKAGKIVPKAKAQPLEVASHKRPAPKSSPPNSARPPRPSTRPNTN